MRNPIVERELVGVLRLRRTLVLLLGVAIVFALLVVLRWPSQGIVGLSGAQSQQVFRLFGYGLLTVLLMMTPAFPAVSIVKEKIQGTLPLLLNSPMNPASIYAGKLTAVIGFALLVLAMSLPAAAACYAMGGVTIAGQLAPLYLILVLVAVQFAAMGLYVSSCASSTDSALRVAYGFCLAMAVAVTIPHLFLQGREGEFANSAEWLRCVSPAPAVMEIMGQSDVAAHGLMSPKGCPARYAMFACATTFGFAVLTVSRLRGSRLDKSKPPGMVTDEQSRATQTMRRLFFLVDPHRRKRSIGPLSNPVMIKEFRSRTFGRSHWVLRLIAVCALASLGLTYAATLGTLDWGVETIGGIMVMLQVALIVLITPSLASGIISAERESGGWELLRMTPLRTGSILIGKLLSVLFMLVLILCATLPGYLVMMLIRPDLWPQVARVLVCLAWMAIFSLMLSAAVSSFCRRTATATTITYAALIALCLGSLLFWLGRDAPFGHQIVENALIFNPMAAALSVIGVSDFGRYTLIPANWWICGAGALGLLVLLIVQTTRLTRPQ